MSRYRSIKNTKAIEINDIRVEHITTKDDKYNNTLPYLMVGDNGFEQK